MAFVYGTIPGFCIVYNMALDPLALFIELVMQEASTNTCYSAKLVLPPQLVLLMYISLSSASSGCVGVYVWQLLVHHKAE